LDLSPEQIREAVILVESVRCACVKLENRLMADGSAETLKGQVEAAWDSDLLDEAEESASPRGNDSENAPAATGHNQSPRASILIAEDNPAYARALGRVASRYGEVVFAETAGQADVALAERRQNWKAFILDVALGDGSGLDVLDRARERFPRTRALFITGYLDSHKVNAAYRLDADLLGKPFSREDVVRFLRSIGRPKPTEPTDPKA
jgi:ActR/RegA family two-component response regulator